MMEKEIHIPDYILNAFLDSKTAKLPMKGRSRSAGDDDSQMRQALRRGLETIVKQMSMHSADRSASKQQMADLVRSGLRDAYVLDLIDRITIRIYSWHEGVRQSYVFDPVKHASKYTRSFLVQLCERQRLDTVGSNADLCGQLGEAGIVESCPIVHLRLYQKEFDAYLRQHYVPFHPLPQLRQHDAKRVRQHAKQHAKHVRYVNTDLIHDLAELARSLHLFPSDAIDQLLRESSARPLHIVYLLDAISVRVHQDDQRLIRLACRETRNNEQFLLRELESLASASAKKKHDGSSIPPPCTKDYLCTLLSETTATAAVAEEPSARSVLQTQLSIDENPLFF